MRSVTWRRCFAGGLVASLTVLATGRAGSGEERKPAVSEARFTQEELQVYKAVLANWFHSEKFSVNLSRLTDSSETASGDCGKNRSFDAASKTVRRFKDEDLKALGAGHIRLVDPDAHGKEVRDNDPGDAIRRGADVNDAVKGGFAHGLFTLGEIRFDRSHTHAIVSFSFWCGALCGHGATMIMEKRDGSWVRQKNCSGWIS